MFGFLKNFSQPPDPETPEEIRKRLNEISEKYPDLYQENESEWRVALDELADGNLEHPVDFLSELEEEIDHKKR